MASANIVGYQNKTADNASSFSWIANTFEKVDGSAVKLKDFSLSESQLPTAVQVFLLGSNGANLKDADGNEQTFVYVHPARCTTANGWVSGWYYQRLGGTNVAAAQFKLGSQSAYWANEYEIPAGTGFGIKRGTAVTTLIIPSPLADNEQ